MEDDLPGRRDVEQDARKFWRRDIIMERLARLGLSRDKSAKLGGRVNPKLLELARERSGAVSDSQLIELALGNLVMEDGFAEAFRAGRGTVDPSLDLDV